MHLLSAVLIGLVAVAPLAIAQDTTLECCPADIERLSQEQVRKLVKKAQPIDPPPLSSRMHFSGTMELAIRVSAEGVVDCVSIVSGHALLYGAVIDSVRRWEFRPYKRDGLSKPFCGRIVLRYEVSDHAVKYKLV